jgi:dienelactone hydrolase
MKKIQLIATACLLFLSVAAKDINGYWNGILRRPNANPLRICFQITQTSSGLKSKMNMPDQGLKHFQMSETSFDSINLRIVSNEAKISYEATFLEANKKDPNSKDSLLGFFNEGGKHYPINVGKGIPDTLVRPQEPKPPISYFSENVIIENKKDKINLAATITLPKKNGLFPIAILIGGPHIQNRDAESYGHKPFWVIADNLAKNGIGCIRFDNRGRGLSTGDIKSITSDNLKDDVEAILNYLQTRPNIDKNGIGLVGFNEGNVIAQITAANRNKEIKFIVMLNGNGIPSDKALLMHNELVGKASGLNEIALKKQYKIHRGAYDIILGNNSSDKIKSKLTNHLAQSLVDTTKKVFTHTDGSIDSIAIKKAKSDSILLAKDIEEQVNTLTSPWMINYIKYNPAPTLEKIKCKVLVFNGEKDVYMPGKVNIEAIVTALQKGGNTSYDSKLFPATNHQLQNCKTGLPNEFEKIEQTISPQLLSEMIKWIAETNDVQAYLQNKNLNTSAR